MKASFGKKLRRRPSTKEPFPLHFTTYENQCLPINSALKGHEALLENTFFQRC